MDKNFEEVLAEEAKWERRLLDAQKKAEKLIASGKQLGQKRFHELVEQTKKEIRKEFQAAVDDTKQEVSKIKEETTRKLEAMTFTTEDTKTVADKIEKNMKQVFSAQ